MEHNKSVVTAVNEIDVTEPKEVSNWADKFDVTNARLKSAVNIVGSCPKKVAAYLKKQPYYEIHQKYYWRLGRCHCAEPPA
jgi:hypothetical protein